MRTCIALFAILLGAVGVVLLSAGVFGVWSAAFAAIDVTEQVSQRASERLSAIDARLVRLEVQVKNVSVDVARIRAAATALTARVAQQALAQSDEFQRLREKLDLLLMQVETYAESLTVVSRLFEDAADLSAQFGKGGEQADRLRAVAKLLDQAAAALPKIRSELTALGERHGEPELRKLTDLIAQASTYLEHIVGGIERIRQYSAHARGELDGLRRGAEFWLVTAATILTALLVWLGLGQLCLAGWGRRHLRRPTVATATTA